MTNKNHNTRVAYSFYPPMLPIDTQRARRKFATISQHPPANRPYRQPAPPKLCGSTTIVPASDRAGCINGHARYASGPGLRAECLPACPATNIEKSVDTHLFSLRSYKHLQQPFRLQVAQLMGSAESEARRLTGCYIKALSRSKCLHDFREPGVTFYHYEGNESTSRYVCSRIPMPLAIG